MAIRTSKTLLVLGGRDVIEGFPSMTSQASIVVGITTTFDLSDGNLIG